MGYKSKKGRSSKKRFSAEVSPTYQQWSPLQYGAPWYSSGKTKRASETFYKHTVNFQRPTRVEAIVKNYFGAPVVLLVGNRSNSFMLRPGEFFDLVSSADVIKRELIKCHKCLVQGKKLNNLQLYTEMPASKRRREAERWLCGTDGPMVMANGEMRNERGEEEEEEEEEEEDEDDEVGDGDKDNNGGMRGKRNRIEINSDTEDDEDGLLPPKKVKLP